MSPSKEQLQKAWEDLQEIHKKYLAPHGVIIPSVDHYDKTVKSIWLAVLYHYRDRTIHKDEISKLVQRDKPGSGADQQVRHLDPDGWRIGTGKRGFHKLDPFKPSAEFLKTHKRKHKKLTAKDFSEIKKAYGNQCATCGAKEGQPNPRYGDDLVKLQQGHKDPSKPGDDLENIIPQCQFCNRGYRNFFVFNDKGRVVTVASEQPIKKARKEVKEKIFAWLCEEFKISFDHEILKEKNQNRVKKVQKKKKDS